jgi:hypothetical protein
LFSFSMLPRVYMVENVAAQADGCERLIGVSCARAILFVTPKRAHVFRQHADQSVILQFLERNRVSL